MSRIQVNDLTFCYEGSFDNIFEKVSFSVDTDWKLGFIGRNGKGKTTFLNLLLGHYEYTGSISANVRFDYFPYQAQAKAVQKEERPAADFLEELKPGCELWRVICELSKLGADAEILYRPYHTLSFGEQTKVMLSLLFSGENEFLLIDEPTNHLDAPSREAVKQYLTGKKGFILVSHDRDLLDACIDHVLVLNRHSIEVQAGNFSSWWENKRRRDAFELAENEKHEKEIAKLQEASLRARRWADKNEGTKIGYDPVKEHERGNGTRPYIGAKTKKMQSRVKQLEAHIDREIDGKRGLLWDIENPVDLKMTPLLHDKRTLLSVRNYSLKYGDAFEPLFQDLSFELRQGERIFLKGANGCGKSSFIRMLLKRAKEQQPGMADPQGETERKEADGLKGGALTESGTFWMASGLRISYISQDTSFLQGSLKEFCKERGLEESLFCAVLRQLDMERVQFKKPMEDYSEGQKKKVLIAASLLTPAHLYVWDEPLNYIDIFSRMQIEKLILAYKPAMLAVEHDIRFLEKISTKEIEMGG